MAKRKLIDEPAEAKAEHAFIRKAKKKGMKLPSALRKHYK
jgi:hypothetical protein